MNIKVENYLLKSSFVFSGSIGPERLVCEWKSRKNIMIVFTSEVLLILEYGVKAVHTISSQKTNVSNHSCHTPGGKSTSRKPNEDDLISAFIVGGNEGVDLTYIFTDTSPKETTSNGIDESGPSTHARVIVDDLVCTVAAGL